MPVLDYTPYKLRDWIPQERICWASLSILPKAVYLLQQNPHKINWDWIHRNPNAVHLIEKRTKRNIR